MVEKECNVNEGLVSVGEREEWSVRDIETVIYVSSHIEKKDYECVNTDITVCEREKALRHSERGVCVVKV